MELITDQKFVRSRHQIAYKLRPLLLVFVVVAQIIISQDRVDAASDKPDMSPKSGKPLVENDAGSYLAWSGEDQPAVAGEKLGCGLLVLKPLGFTMPHYADSPKFGYVLSGSAVAGVLPVAGVDGGGVREERVVRLVAGDVIATRAGEVTWWYNDDATGNNGKNVTILFMADTAGAGVPGDISYFILGGTNAVLAGLDTSLLATATGLKSPEQAAAAFRSQPAALLARLRREQLRGVRPREHDRHGLVVNGAAGTGTLKMVTAAELPLLGEIGLSVGHLRLDGGGAGGPWVLRDAAALAVYVARGSGRVQLAGAGNGGASIMLDAQVTAGGMLVVPRYAVALVGADAGGIELVSLIKSPRPAVERFTGKGSVLGILTPEIVQAALNVSSELAQQLRTK